MKSVLEEYNDQPDSVEDEDTTLFDAFTKNSTVKTDEEYFKEWDETPLFMQQLPQDPQSNQTLSALSALLYDGTSLEQSINFKNQGNQSFKQNQFKDALAFYQKSLDCKSMDLKLDSIILSNRAKVHFRMKNYRKSITDCELAVKCDAMNLKAYFRCSKSLIELRKPVLALKCINTAISIDPENQEFQGMKIELDSRIKEENRKTSEIKRAIEMNLEKERLLMVELVKRGIECINKDYQAFKIDSDSLFNSEKHSLLPPTYHPQSGTSRVTLQDETLRFPVMFLYPEYQESDFIAQFHEDTLFIEIIEILFEEKARWDIDQKYVCGRVDVYYEHRGRLVSVKIEESLKDVLSKGLNVVQGFASLIILPTNCDFERDYIRQHGSVS